MLEANWPVISNSIKFDPTGKVPQPFIKLAVQEMFRDTFPGRGVKAKFFDKFDPKNSHLLPAIIHKVHQAKITGKQSVEIWGDGSARREFMYIEDLADAIYFALESISDIPDLMNIGVGTDYTIKEYYESVALVVGWQGEFVFDYSKPTGMAQKLSDTSLQLKWGWQPKTTLKEGIRSTYKYYLENVF